MNPTEHYVRVADDLGRVLGGVTDWSAPTPCEEWDARALAAHVIAVHRRAVARLDGSEPVAPTVDEDLASAWPAVRAAVEQALADRGGQEIESFGQPQPFAEMVDTLLCADTLLHTWDLARGTGQDETLDLTAVSKAHAFLTPLGDAMRAPGGFGPEKPVVAEASAQDRLIAFAGREPATG